jgi:general secretion pathway protein A
MYLPFYKLSEYPFSMTCDERFFYESSIHAEALANMMYTIQQRKGMVLITGEVGAGKTFIGHILGARLGAGYLTVMISNPAQSAKQLLRAIATRVGLDVHPSTDKLGTIEELERHLVRLHGRGRPVALVLDEAQDLPDASLEEVRLLWNWESDGDKLLQIVLVGQPELRRRLREAKWEPLRQRIVLSYHLGHLSRGDTAGYIDQRLKVASEGDPAAGFTPEAKQEIHAATDGIPRLINILCDNALLVGYARGTHAIDRSIVAEVLKNMTCWDLRVRDESSEPARSTEVPVGESE